MIIIVGMLLLLSMLLVNFVLIIFWQRDAVQREINRDQGVLARVLSRLPADVSALGDLAPDSFSFADYYSSEEKGRILLSIENKDPVVVIDFSAPLLISTISETIHTGKPAVHYSGSFLGLISFRSHVLVSVQPIVRRGRVIGAVGINRSLEPMFQSLWRVEKIVLVYILINLLILSVIGFFRMRKVVVRPIERLVRLADQYNDQQIFCLLPIVRVESLASLPPV